jgi:hypothetical protein
VPIVAHRRNFRPWLVTMEADAFFRLLRGEFLGTTEDAEYSEGRSNSGGLERNGGAVSVLKPNPEGQAQKKQTDDAQPPFPPVCNADGENGDAGEGILSGSPSAISSAHNGIVPLQ